MRWLLFSLALIVGTAQSQQPQQAPKLSIEKEGLVNGAVDQKAQTKIAVSEIPPVGKVNVISSIGRPSDSCYAKCGEYKPDKEWWHELRADPVATFTCLLFFATLALWWSTRGLVKGAENTAEKQLRAYVALDDIRFPRGEELNPPMPGVPITWTSFILRPKNYGQTPAHDMTIWKQLVQEEPKIYDHQRLLVDEQMLHPTQGYSVDVRIPEGYDSTSFAGWFVYGRFIYRDVFKRWWVTKFCYQCAGPNGFVPVGPYNKEEGPHKSKEEALSV